MTWAESSLDMSPFWGDSWAWAFSFPSHKQPQYRGQSWRVSSTECGIFLPLRHWDSHWREQVDCPAGGGCKFPPARQPLHQLLLKYQDLIQGPRGGRETIRKGWVMPLPGHTSTLTHTQPCMQALSTHGSDQVTGLSATTHGKEKEPDTGVSLRWLRAPRNLFSGYFPQGSAGLEHSFQGMF